MATAKEEMTRIIQERPDDSSYDEILRELEDAQASRTISDSEMSRRIKTWR